MTNNFNRNKLDDYLDSLLFASDASDIRYFETKVRELLDEKAKDVLNKLNEDEKSKYEDLKTNLINANYNNESIHYENEIYNLIDNVIKRAG